MRSRILQRFLRVISMVALAVTCTSCLMFLAPGYFSDEREMDAVHGQAAQLRRSELNAKQATIGRVLLNEIFELSHGDLGTSRQFGLPVGELLRASLPSSGRTLVSALGLGWTFALALSLPLSFRRCRTLDLAVALTTVAFLAIPVSALAIFSLLLGHDSPALVLGLVVGVRDLKLLHKQLRTIWQEPFLLHARAQGLSVLRILSGHVFPALRYELSSIALMSFTLALSALVPVEVVFDRAGIGKLAWTAAMNRDLPLLVGVTILIAGSIGLTSLLGEQKPVVTSQLCAD